MLFGRSDLALVLGVIVDGHVGYLQVIDAVVAVAKHGEARKARNDCRVSCGTKKAQRASE